MGRQATGTVQPTKDGGAWEARYTLHDGKRGPWGELPGSDGLTREQAKALAASYAPRVRAESGGGPGAETIEGYVKRWLDDREGRVASIKDDRARMRDHILPILGRLDARTATRDGFERVRDALDAKITKGELAWKTAGHCWSLVRKLGDDMANARNRELRVRADNPAAGIKRRSGESASRSSTCTRAIS
ncbi:MAG TPA: hypothetical protein VE987_10080 [Polyangiaceae bacterium]|nr:hypothetical protein [Polyangiaceae bacterium]